MNDNPFSVSDSYSDDRDLDLEPPQKRVWSPISFTELAVGLFIILILIGLLVPTVRSGPHARRRMMCANNLKQISLAMLNYEEANGCFPPAYTVDAEGNRLHSWRTLLLPYLEEQELYQKIDLAKPWAHPVNAKFNSYRLSIYDCPSSNAPSGRTTYVVVDDSTSIFDGSNTTAMEQIEDGTSCTLLVIEVDQSHAVAWMSPEDIDLPTFLDTEFRTGHSGGGNCALADGSIHFLDASLDEDSKHAIATKAAGDEFELAP